LHIHPKEEIRGFILSLPLVHPFKTSFGEERERKFALIRVRRGELEGWGEVVASEAPLYSEETLASAVYLLKNYLFPMALSCGLDPRCFEAEAEKFRGNPMAKAGLSLALWDLEARRRGLPLHRVYGGVRKEIPSGVSVGIQTGLDELLSRIDSFVREGYLRVKIKIAPGWDCEVVKEVRKAFPQIPLGADANSAYGEGDLERLSCLDGADLLFLEQPLYPDDLYFHSLLKKKIKTPIALDESVKNLRKMKVGYLMDSYSLVNIKVGRMGGIGEVLRAAEFASERGIPLFCGGMLESGVGRAHNLHLASLEPFVLPADISRTQRYYHRDLTPPFDFSTPGYIPVPQGEGIGVDVDNAYLEKITLESF